MVDATQIKSTTVKVLACIEKVSSFASSFNPIFGIVSSLVGMARKGLTSEEGHALEKDFQAIRTRLENISKKNQECPRQIHIQEVNETFGKYEEYIKHQYDAFNTMVALMKKDPHNNESHMETFKTTYERDESDESLDVYYRGVMGSGTLFGKPLLQVYLKACDKNLNIMEHRCSHIAHLFHMGLIALMAYTAVTKDDEDEVRKKWAKRVLDIQTKMQEVLGQCKDKAAP